MMLLMHGVMGASHPRWLLLLPLVILSGILSAALGRTLGTHVQPRFSGLLFAVVIGPLMLFAALLSVASLTASGQQSATCSCSKPLTFMSEAMRLAVTPDIPHIAEPLLSPAS